MVVREEVAMVVEKVVAAMVVAKWVATAATAAEGA